MMERGSVAPELISSQLLTGIYPATSKPKQSPNRYCNCPA